MVSRAFMLALSLGALMPSLHALRAAPRTLLPRLENRPGVLSDIQLQNGGQGGPGIPREDKQQHQQRQMSWLPVSTYSSGSSSRSSDSSNSSGSSRRQHPHLHTPPLAALFLLLPTLMILTSTLTLALPLPASAINNLSSLSQQQITDNVFDPSSFQPVCPGSDGLYQVRVRGRVWLGLEAEAGSGEGWGQSGGGGGGGGVWAWREG